VQTPQGEYQERKNSLFLDGGALDKILHLLPALRKLRKGALQLKKCETNHIKVVQRFLILENSFGGILVMFDGTSIQ
jgi:hypothetical protein